MFWTYGLKEMVLPHLVGLVETGPGWAEEQSEVLSKKVFVVLQFLGTKPVRTR